MFFFFFFGALKLFMQISHLVKGKANFNLELSSIVSFVTNCNMNGIFCCCHGNAAHHHITQFYGDLRLVRPLDIFLPLAISLFWEIMHLRNIFS